MRFFILVLVKTLDRGSVYMNFAFVNFASNVSLYVLSAIYIGILKVHLIY